MVFREQDQRSDQEITPVSEFCTVCRDMKTVLNGGSKKLDLGCLNEIMQSPCQVLVEMTSHLLKSNQPRPNKSLVGSTNIHLTKLQDIAGVRFWMSSPLFSHNYLLLSPAADGPMLGSGRHLDSDWVDIEILRSWKQECSTNHGDLCRNPFRIRHTHPTWLIDVANNCLVPGNGIADYIALSYRWGGTSCLQTKLNNLDALRQRGALLLPEFANRLSATIQHTAKLINMLGERYLWADALCIVQDDNEQITHQLLLSKCLIPSVINSKVLPAKTLSYPVLRKCQIIKIVPKARAKTTLTHDSTVGAIYASAKFTVVAADGDASHGIPGLRGISQPRGLHRVSFPLGKKDTIIQRGNPPLGNTPGGSSYFSRAWTFQEFFLSKRRLIIGNKQFHWSCSSATFHEDLNGTDSGSQEDWNARFQASDILCGIPRFQELGPLFSEYSCRELTFPEDALAGVSGLIAVMSRSFEGGFNYGIPDMYFESALTWSQFEVSDSVQRRMHSGGNHSILPGSQLPSWSWLGWKMETRGLRFFKENTGELSDTSGITTCITQWYSHETPHSSTKRAIRSKLADHDENFTKHMLDDRIALAQGWTKEIFDYQKHRKSEPSHFRNLGLVKLGDFVYQHQRLPGRHFWYPFSLVEINDMPTGDERPQHPFLSCKTQRGWFQATSSRYLKQHQVLILKQDGSCCGSLSVDCKNFAEKFQSQSNGPIESSQSIAVELVAICQTKYAYSPLPYRYKGTPEMLRKERPQFTDERYSVLWIEWIGGIAYRKGCGGIDKLAWESNPLLDEVDLVLG